jgi:hypothetical protein
MPDGTGLIKKMGLRQSEHYQTVKVLNILSAIDVSVDVAPTPMADGDGAGRPIKKSTERFR